jgi:hypothetical protein
MPVGSVAALLGNAVDYAGMFPPASLPFREVVDLYRRYRDGAEGWIVGTLVIAAERSGELEPEVGPVSLVVKTPTSAAIAPLMEGGRPLQVASIEFGPVPPVEIPSLAAAVPSGIQTFFEVPVDSSLERRLDAVASCRARAKIRTGGVVATAFPPAEHLYRFFRACADRGLAAKATAGLHHLLSGWYPLTYEPASPSAAMFGFLNVSVAAALVHAGEDKRDVLDVLGESSPTAFQLDDQAVHWRNRQLSVTDLRATREALFRSFGSCSLREPLDELAAIAMR